MRKKATRNHVQQASLLIFFCCVLVGAITFSALQQKPLPQSKLASKISEAPPTPDPTTVATPTPSPTPTPIPYPPKGWHCTHVPILMYHHIQPLEDAKREGHAQLTVDPGAFQKQMEDIKKKGYTPTTLTTLANFFDATGVLPTKPLIITVDDGYQDFFTHALPILREFGYPSTLFAPTGLLENEGYVSWNQLRDMKGRGVEIGHHSWSHANLARTNTGLFAREIDLPTQQFLDHGLGTIDIFAYPYGTFNASIRSYLQTKGFRIAVTTLPGSTQCVEDRLALHRTRMGNAPLSSYGL